MKHDDTATPASRAPQPTRAGRPSSPGLATSWAMLGMDASRLASDHIFAIAAAACLLLANVTRWTLLVLHRIQLIGDAGAPRLDRIMPMGRGWGANGGHMAGTPGNLFTQLWHLLSSLVIVHSVPSLLINALALLLILGFAQHSMGIGRTVCAALSGSMIGTALGLGLYIAVNSLLGDWGAARGLVISLSPFTLAVGALMAASAYQGPLWRRRLLLVGYAGIGALLLFSGNPGDYCTLAAAMVGHVIGRIMHGRPESSALWWSGTDYETRRMCAAVQLVLAVGPVLALTSNAHIGPLSRLGLLMAPSLGGSVCLNKSSTHGCLASIGAHQVLLHGGLWVGTMTAVAAIAVVAWGLYRGRRLAVWTSILLNVLTSLFVVVYYFVFPLTLDMQLEPANTRLGVAVGFVVTALPSAIFATVLMLNRAHFPIRTNPSRIRLGALAIAVSLASTAMVFIGFGMSAPGAFLPRANLLSLLHDLPRQYLPIGFAARSQAAIHPVGIVASLVTVGVAVVFWASVLLVFIWWFRDDVHADVQERALVDRLLERSGESMSFMTTWEGNRYWFSPTQRSGIAYRVLHGVALTVTGPFGDPAEYQMVFREFIRFCDMHSWSPAFYALHADQQRQLSDWGGSSIQVGTEMLIIPSEWHTTGKKWQDIRTAVNKAKRTGITDVLTTYEAADWRIREQIVEISEQWSHSKALPEMKFTLGGVEELRDPRVSLLYAIDAESRVQGVTSWLPTYREGRLIGWTLDFMRHRTDSPNGVMEFLIAKMAERMKALGESDPEHAVEFVSLSAAPLAGLGEDGAAGPAVITHALRIVANALEPAYGFTSLYFFKSKFQPTSRPVYLSYFDAGKLPQIALAITGSYLPELRPAQLLDMLKAVKTN